MSDPLEAKHYPLHAVLFFKVKKIFHLDKAV